MDLLFLRCLYQKVNPADEYDGLQQCEEGAARFPIHDR